MKYIKFLGLVVLVFVFIGILPQSDALPELSVNRHRIHFLYTQTVQKETDTLQNVKEIARKGSPAVVMVNGYTSVPNYVLDMEATVDGIVISQKQIGASLAKISSGSGFFVTANGYILTNKHVVADSGTTYMVNAGSTELPAEIVYKDPQYDLAVLKVSGSGYPTIALADSEIKVGENVVTIGNALGMITDSVSYGIVSGINKKIAVDDETSDSTSILQDLIQTSAQLYPGDSGGPLLNEKGEAIGVDVATSVRSRTSFAIPSYIAKAVLKRANVQA